MQRLETCTNDDENCVSILQGGIHCGSSSFDVPPFLMDVLNRYRAFEDEDVRQATKRYYGPFLRICSILPSFDNGWIILTLAHVFIMAISVPTYMYSLGMSSYLLIDDFLIFGIEVHYFVIVLAIGALYFYAFVRREVICNALRMMNRFYDYGDTDITEEEKKGLEKIIAAQRLWFIPVAILVAISASFMAIWGPLIDNLIGAAETRAVVNGVYMRAPIPVYFPFEIKSDLMHYLASAYPIVVTALLTPIIGGILMLYIVKCQFLAHHHRILIMSVKNLFPRSATAYKRIYRRDIGENWSILADDDGFQSCVTFSMKQNIEHHQRMREFFHVISDLIELPLLFAFIVATFILALALFGVTEETNRIGLLLTSLLSMITEVAMIYIVCF